MVISARVTNAKNNVVKQDLAIPTPTDRFHNDIEREKVSGSCSKLQRVTSGGCGKDNGKYKTWSRWTQLRNKANFYKFLRKTLTYNEKGLLHEITTTYANFSFFSYHPKKKDIFIWRLGFFSSMHASAWCQELNLSESDFLYKRSWSLRLRVYFRKKRTVPDNLTFLFFLSRFSFNTRYVNGSNLCKLENFHSICHRCT